MKFLVISEKGCASGLAWKLKTEGHDVYYYIKNPEYKNSLDGMVKKLTSLNEASKQSPDVVLLDGDLGSKDFDEKLRKSGWKVIGGSDWGNKLVKDQKFANKVMETFEIRSPRMFSFSTITTALEFVNAQEGFFAIEAGEYCFTPHSKNELVQYMKLLQKKYDSKCLLQEVITGQDVSIELWYSKGTPLAYPITKLETNYTMPGDLGEYSCGQTSLAFSYPTRQPKLVQESLKRMQIFLERVQYTGFLCLYGTVKKNRFYGKRFSTNTSASAISLLQEPLGDVLNRMANVDLSNINFGKGYGYAMKLNVPCGTSYIDISHEDCLKVFANEMQETKQGYFTTGKQVLECAAYKNNMFDAEKVVNDQFKAISVPNKQGRLFDGIRFASRYIDALVPQGYEMPPFPVISTYSPPKEAFKPVEQEPVILPQVSTLEAPRESDGLPTN